ncbi:dicarboxylate/amino acid:cation symporter [Vulgatibacter incomptus]|uniref:Proton/glutamate symport protein n=1 Tax=Vulgatibacter incomptus TaxID=1391653 RepID=A0A0K1PJI1_9BACT|nr:dicarboxylate/amino acid:cation symporter [Vulgatibacter incomptus]AKU93244.1 Proton/glutamate symport protein [Vulgatibacter incomptus]
MNQLSSESKGASRVPAWLLPALMLTGALLGMLIGALAGARWDDPAWALPVALVRLPGTIFLSLLKALIVPLVVTSIVTGVTKMGDLRKVGRIAGYTGAYFILSTFLAVFTGIVLVNVFLPGHRGSIAPAAASLPAAVTSGQGTIGAVSELIQGMFPANLAGAAVDGNILGLIIFSLLFGTMLSFDAERSRPLVDVLEAANEALLRLVHLVLWLAPLGVLGLVADRIGKAGGGAAVWSDLTRLAWYGGTVVLGLVIHSVITLPLILRIFAGRSPTRFAAGMTDSLVTAVGTGSSAATMPVTMRCLVENNGISRRAADFVIPLGTTINMNGTALYEAVAAIFIAQSLGIELSLIQQVIVLFTATLAAVGAAAIPEAGLVTMVLVLGAVGLPAEGIGLILAIDWILDRFRTGVNVWGDAIGAGLVDKRLATWGAAATSPEPAGPTT